MRHVVTLALLLGLVGCHHAAKATGPLVDIDRSTVTVDRTDSIRADGVDAAHVTVTLLAPSGAPLADTALSIQVTGTQNTLAFSGRTDAHGVATAALSTTVAEVKVIFASVGSALVKTRVSSRFVAGPASSLGFSVQPSPALLHVAIAPAIIAVALDPLGNVADTGIAIALSLSGGTAGATLSGTTTRGAVHGRATYTDLAVGAVGSGYVLTATAAGLASGTSAPFAITAGGTPSLAYATQPSNAAAGSSIAPAVVVAVRDAAGALIDSNGMTLSVALGSSPGSGTLAGTRYQPTVHGLATFNDLHIDVAGSNYTLVASGAGFTGVTSSAFTVVPGAPCQCNTQFTATPAAAAADGAHPIALSLVVHDDHGNLVPGATVAFTSSVQSDHFARPDGSAPGGGFVTDGQGSCQASVTATVAGSRQLSASFGDDAPRTLSVTFN